MLNLSQLDALIRQTDPATPDADLAAQLSVPVKTPRDVAHPGSVVTYASLAARWGASRAAQFAGSVLAGKANANASLAGLCILADAVLGGPGLTPSDEQSQLAAGQFVAAGLASQAEVDGALYDIGYPAGAVATADDVTASRARLAALAATDARRAANDALRDRIVAAKSAFINDLYLNHADPETPALTWADYQAAVAGAQ